MTGHAKIISPSAAKRVLLCPASPLACKGIPNTSGAAADRGTALHRVAELCLEGFEDAADYVGQEVEGRVIDEDDVDLVQPYVDWVREYAPDDMELECRLDVSGATMEPGGTGTADIVAYKRDAEELLVGDLKTGRVPVDPLSPQLLIYGHSALAKYPRAKTVRFMIGQTMAGGAKEAVLAPADLDAKIKAMRPALSRAVRLYGGVEDAKPEDYQPSYEACKWCPAGKALKCPAREMQVIEDLSCGAATVSEFEEFDAPIPDEAAKLSRMWHRLAFVRAFCDDVEAEIERRIADGQSVPGIKQVQGKEGNRKWQNNLIAELALSNNSLYSEPTCLSPAQAEKAHKAGKVTPEEWEQLKADIVRPEGKLVIVSESDPRPAAGRVTPDDFN